MTHREGQMSLVLFFNPVGRLTHSWRREQSGVEGLLGLEMAAFSAKTIEAAKFDAFFVSDKASFDDDPVNPDLNPYEPMVTLGALAAVTEHVGLIATVSTTFTEPYNMARQFAQLDFLSHGRSGWNIVTSYSGAQNFAKAMPEKSERYRQAQDYLTATELIWDAWDDDAVMADRERGVWADASKIHHPDYVGPYFRVHDALTMPRMPQGRPVIVQAGQSEEGVAFAARNAELIFTSQSHLPSAIEFSRRIKSMASDQFGRDAGTIKIAPGIIPIVGETEAEANAIADELADLVTVEVGLRDLSNQLLGVNLSDLDLDSPIPTERLLSLEEAAKSTMLSASRYGNLYRVVTEERPTLRQLIRTRTKSQGHHLVKGTPEQIADRMQEWWDAGACDGFTVIPAYMPEGLQRFCDFVVPELQRRGIFRTEYPGTTLRDTLGLERPRVVRETQPA